MAISELSGGFWLVCRGDSGYRESRLDGFLGQRFGAVQLLEQLGQCLARFGAGPRGQACAVREVGGLGRPPGRAGRNRAGGPGRVDAGQARQRPG